MESFGEAKQSKPQTVDDLMAEWYRYKKSPYSSGVVKDRVDKIKSDYDHNLHFFLKRGQEMIAHDNKIDSVASYLKSAKSRSLLFYYAFTEWLEEKRKQKASAEIAQLVDEHYQLSHQVESCQKRIAEIDKLVAEREARLFEIDQSQRNFNTYLAVKEGSLTPEDIVKGVEDAANEG